MHVTLRGATFVRAGRERVWAALHDTGVIRRCVPGCRSLAQTSDTLCVLSSRIAVGPLRITMSGAVEWAESDPPRSCRLVGHGSGGRLSADGELRIVLVEEAGGCRMSYSIEADARGPFALGGPVVMSGIGRGLSALFASRFGAMVERGARSQA